MQKHLIALLCLGLLLISSTVIAQKSDRAQIEETLWDYMDGGTNGDTTRLVRAFHPSATMKYINKQTGQFTDVPIADYLGRAKTGAGKKIDRKTKILTLDVVGTAAQAKLELDYATFQFIDYFNLVKINEKWLIVSKIFYRLDKAKLVAKDTISTGEVFGLAVQPGGNQAFFVRSYGGRDSLHLYNATRQQGRWSKPTKAAFSGKYKDIDPAFSPDGKQMLFNSTRPVLGKTATDDFDIWTIRQTPTGWSEPEHLGNVINSDSSDFYATMAGNGTIYFTSDRAGGVGKRDIWRSVQKNGIYQKPENLGTVVNTPSHQSNPCISPQEDYLIFLTDRPDSLGDSDLYISFRVNNRWTSPQHLGPDINTPDAEFAPTLDLDPATGRAKTLYFGRIKRGKPQVENIYQINNFEAFLAPFRQAAQTTK